MTFQPPTAAQMPRFAGIPTFFRLPYVTDPRGLDVAILGVPFDGGQYSLISGARFGPRSAREASARIRPYNLSLKRNPYDRLKVADCGDLLPNPLDLDAARQTIEDGVRRVVDAGAIPLCMGGDHAISLPILRGLAALGRPLGMIHFDAHSDTADEDLGTRYGHGTPFRRAVEEGLLDPRRTIQIGLRGTTEDDHEFDWALGEGMEIIMLDDVLDQGLAWVASRYARLQGGPIYVSVDMDVLDPAYAPATGPNPGGLAARELLFLLRKIFGHDVVGGDVVEFDAPYDVPSRPTAVLAANLLYELVCLCDGGTDT